MRQILEFQVEMEIECHLQKNVCLYLRFIKGDQRGRGPKWL